MSSVRKRKYEPLEGDLALFLVSYDLDKPEKDYPKLIDALKAVGAQRVLYSEWMFNADNTAVQVRDHFKAFIDGDDHLLVVVVSDWASRHTMVDISKIA